MPYNFTGNFSYTDFADLISELAYNNLQLSRQIKKLEGIIPICSYCKKIRDDKGAWDMMEAYICAHSEAEFSHGVCPECYKKQMEELENTE